MSESSIRQRHVDMVAAFVILYEESPSGINMRRDAWWEPCLHKIMLFFSLALGKYLSVCLEQMCYCGENRILNSAG